MPGKKNNTNLDTIGLEMGNTPPQALDVEEAVLGAMLLEAAAVDQAMEELTPNCFYDQRHRMIFEAIAHLVTEHTSVDIFTATNKLKQEGNLEAVGGAITLANLSQKVGSAAHIEYHIKILKQKSIQRELITASYDILHQAYDESVKVDDLVDNAQTKIFDAIQNNLKKEVQGIGDLINVAMSDIQKMQNSIGLSGVPSGFVSLDSITMGWQKSDLIILAARPAIGKTAFALNMARNAAVDHHMPVAVFSLEMSAVQLTKRLMTSESGLPASKIKGGSKLEPYEWEQLEYKLKNLSAAPLYIDDTPSIPVMEFRTKVKNLVKSKQVRLVIVDYLQLMQGPSELRGMREQEVAAISRTLKQTAKELEVPIIALSQLSRQSVQRSGGSGRPQLSDLRESGSIEQDADMVIFIHRPDALGLSENPSSMEETQIIIAKHRNGSVGELPMIFKSEQIRFLEPNQTLDVRAAATVASGINGSPSDDFGNPNF
ncbi:MAG: replicative DNA helicase [Bacteroidales bacterium]|jgi:replicative DNA helicase|nr:replicative DNA helicase [Bacteroidales bacterium]